MQNEEYCSYWSSEFSRKEYDVSARIDWTPGMDRALLFSAKRKAL